MASNPDAHLPTPRIAVAIPCYNEAAAIAEVIAQWRLALPVATIYVFDNNSSDGSGAIARAAGAHVVEVPDQGKGHVVQAIFSRLMAYDAVVMIDGDGTYPANGVGQLLAPVLDGSAEMTIGARVPVAGAGAMTLIRRTGNLLIRAAFRILIGRAPGDLLSGYRVFSRTFRESVVLRSVGFEIETELTSEAVSRGLRTQEFAVPYCPRIQGTVSKLNAFRDGKRILVTIVRQSLRMGPWRLLALTLAIGLVACLVVWLFR